MEIKKILWPTDFCENAAQALSFVTSLAEKYAAEIHLCSVADRVTKCTDVPIIIIPV